MLQCYLDDSGTHDGSHNCVIAGYWGGVNEWRRFEREWKKVLDSEGIEEFKANEFWPRINGERVGPYKTWDDERHSSFIDRLLRVIETHKIAPFAFGVLGSEWESLPPHFRQLFSQAMASPKPRNDVGKSIFMPFQLCVCRVLTYCHPGVVMHFVMDEDERIAPKIVRSYSELKISAEEDHEKVFLSHLGELTFADSRKARPLQAADLLAYEAHRYAKRAAAERNPRTPIRKEYRRALRRFRSMDDFWLFDSVRMSRLVFALEANMRRMHAQQQETV
jgi:hypothetical protein